MNAADTYGARYVAIIDLLRRNEGSVTILAKDANFGECVEVVTRWTRFKPRRFHGTTVLEALEAAYMETPSHARVRLKSPQGEH